MHIVGIVAHDLDNGIGKNGSIPWKNKEDMKFFVKTTKSGEKPAILMGRKTFQSIGHHLEDRINIVISSQNIVADYCNSDIRTAINWAINHDVSHLYVIGGAGIYYWFAKYELYDKFYTSIINGVYQCDVFINDTLTKIKSHCNEQVEYASVQLITYENDLIDEKRIKRLMTEIRLMPFMTNRTAVKTQSVFNKFLRFNLNNNVLPACTLRKQWLKGIFCELMWFVRGETDIKILHRDNVHIWDANAVNGEVGPIYGHQWRHFGAPWKPNAPSIGGFDQLAFVINELKNNPTSRRIVLSGWFPPDIFNQACLPPCHILYQWNVSNGNLYCMVTQRSSDVALALAWNIISGAMLTHLLAKICDLNAVELVFSIGNAHLYENHIPAVEKLLSRDERRFPRIFIDEKKPIEEYIWSDINIVGYDPNKVLDVGGMVV